jgi:hypothetical protein
VFQGNGSATFDGLSKVTVTMTADTIQSVGTPVTWSGTYTMQSNCFGVATITSGGSATLNLVAYDLGTNFLATGNDATYSYTNGTGNNQPTGCSAGTLSGVYSFSGSGFNLSGGSVVSVGNGTGLLQFDGQSAITVNVTLSGGGNTTTASTLTGTYSMSSACVGSATLTDSKANSYAMTFSVTNATTVNSADFFLTLAQSGKFLISGTGHPIYGQPAPTAAARKADRPATPVFVKLLPAAVHGERL